MNQRVSLSCVLSALSPVTITSSGFSARTARTSSASTIGSSPSCGPVGGVVGRADLVDELDPRRRLLVDELRVGHLGEVDEPRRRAAGATLREIGAELGRLGGPVLEAVVAVSVDDRSAGLRQWLRGCTADGEQEDR